MLLLKGAAQVVTPPASDSPLTGDMMGRVELHTRSDVAIRNGRIVEVGRKLDYPDAEVIDARGKVVVPGFVDPHTHLVWAGSREHELEWKLQGRSYQDILADGGGILRTVKETRAASEEELREESLHRLRNATRYGTTTIEIKSGYGLQREDELKQLRVARWLGEQGLAEVVSTFMGAHAFPPDSSRSEYIEQIEEMLPEVAELAEYCDVFCEEGAFTTNESRRLLEAAREAGMGLRIHADEFGDTGGGTLGAELKVASADHLSGSSMATIEALRDAGVTGILLPGTPLALLESKFASARKMVAAELPLALATDCNPNCYTESMQLVMQLAVFRMKLTPGEALTAATLNGALALGRSNRGAIASGWRADLLVCNVPDYRHLTYHFGINHVETVIIGGRIANA
ncbi:MAG: imidazolonepropionase [Candidatus Poseidoniia archaeon]|jgi:imidazolonepropionase|nr:imidazolonepropionase [Euryarchaeota archaeon]MDP6489238.1 imidazolonepropionase [Candidatus Poseidoniia archaeon]MDP6534598.1 imidazolonepropionase [Candidatus Poseidoniia archaeon]MDP6834936.1 imidazolonepropionase [Candidatus Poseidoniia archaeon]